ncbi:MAG: biotin--[Alphaproteobacteria bacterium]|nr:biotin--[acetyl-CoA-carboxylase] ligase [Alphaproteobacteria bacterium]
MAGYKVFSFDKIPSTQDMAHELIADGRATNRTAVVALAQSAGRGRYRRKWVSHHGNLYVSFIYGCDTRDGRLSYATAVAVAETLISYGINPTIKWPNDILIDNKKVAGILIEYSGPYVIVGIGININTNPTVAEYKTTRLANYTDVNANDLMARLIRNLDKWRRCDFSVVRARWMQLVEHLNRDVLYHGAPAELIGINENGALILRRDTRYLLVYGDEITML